MIERTWRRASAFSLGQIMLAGMAMLLVALLFRGLLGPLAGPMLIAGLLLAAGAFLLSAFGGGRHRTIAGRSTVEKRWRGQVIDYSEPSTTERLKDWFRRRRR